jgi:hypothetical protein
VTRHSAARIRSSSGLATGRERSASAHNHPGPDNETNWLPAPTVRTITAYQRVGWLAIKQIVPKPTPPQVAGTATAEAGG